MNKDKILQIILGALLGISLILSIVFYAKDEDSRVAFLDILINWSYLLIAISLLVGFVYFPGVVLSKNTKTAKGAIMGVAALIVIFIISYTISSDDASSAVYTKFAITNGESKLIGGMLIGTYFVGILTVLAAIYAEVSKLFK